MSMSKVVGIGKLMKSQKVVASEKVLMNFPRSQNQPELAAKPSWKLPRSVMEMSEDQNQLPWIPSSKKSICCFTMRKKHLYWQSEASLRINFNNFFRKYSLLVFGEISNCVRLLVNNLWERMCEIFMSWWCRCRTGEVMRGHNYGGKEGGRGEEEVSHRGSEAAASPWLPQLPPM